MCLSYLCKFLEEMSKNSSVTKMDVCNLSIVFATNILRPITETQEELFSFKIDRITHLTTKLISNVNVLFSPDNEPAIEEPDWFKELKNYAKENPQTASDTTSPSKVLFGITKRDSAMEVFNFMDIKDKLDRLETTRESAPQSPRNEVQVVRKEPLSPKKQSESRKSPIKKASRKYLNVTSNSGNMEKKHVEEI